MYETKLFVETRELDEYLNSLEGKFEIISITHDKCEIFLTIKR